MATFKSTLTEKVTEPNLLARVSDTDSDGDSGSDIDSYNGADGGLSDSGLDDEDIGDLVGNPRWADAMAKILNTNKPKHKKTIVLAKAKKLSDVVQKEKVPEIGFEVVGEVKEEKPTVDVKPDVDVKPSKISILKHEWYSRGRFKPNIIDKDRERTLAKIGTKGVVQLFNAVKQQQKEIHSRIGSKGSVKKLYMSRNIDKRAFLDVVSGVAKSVVVDNPVKDEAVTLEVESREPVTWNVLRDDFMMGGKYKDWDREEPSQAAEEMEVEDSDSSDD